MDMAAPGGPCGDQNCTVAAFAAVMPESDVLALREWIASCAAVWTQHASALPEPLVLVPTEDRTKRGTMHALVRQHMHWVESDTVGPHDDPAKSVRLRARPGSRHRKRPAAGNHDADGARRRRVTLDGGDANTAVPQPGNSVLSFVLCKENTDTHAALAVVASMLGVPSKALCIAGTKDKRGVTCQRVTLAKCNATRLLGINARLIAMRVGTPAYTASHLGLGDLAGNRFCVTLRHVQCHQGEVGVASALEALRRHGFINYFGLQRFGASAEARTHATGAALLRGEWETAVQLIMAPRAGERQDMTDARAAWATNRDAKTALQRLPRGAAAERAVMTHFAKQGNSNSLVPALTSIPRTLRMMYVHAYQSYLFNHAASHRVETYGLNAAVEGDLVFVDPTSIVGIELGSDNDDDDDGAAAPPVRVRYVTAEEAAAGSVPIDEVVLPLPAAGVLYPRHATADVYTRLAAADGVNLSGGQHNIREFSLSGFTGGYRHVVHHPKDLSWRLLRYDDPDADLTRTPLDEALIAEGRRTASATALPPPSAGVYEEVQGEGRYLALQLVFTLPPSGYATMLTRELLKSSTSITFHKGLSAAHGTGVAADGAQETAVPPQD